MNAKHTQRIDAVDAAPKAGTRWLPTWIMLATAILAYRGCLFVDENGAAFNPSVQGPWTEAALVAVSSGEKEDPLGKETYLASCAPCHQANGLGTPGQFPPLVGSEWVLAPGPNRIIRIVLHGAQGPFSVKGVEFNNVMVPWKDSLDDKKIAAVITYIRQNKDWGHAATPVKPEQVKKIREATKDQGAAMTADELKKVNEAD